MLDRKLTNCKYKKPCVSIETQGFLFYNFFPRMIVSKMLISAMTNNI